MSQESDFQAAKVRFFMAKKARQEAAPDWAKWSKVFWRTLAGLFIVVLALASPVAGLSVLGILVPMPILPIVVAIALVVVVLTFSSRPKTNL